MTTVTRLVPYLVALAMLWTSPLQAAEPEEGNQTAQEFAREILFDMANFMAGLERFGVTVRGGFDAVQDDGRKIEFLERQQVTISRPNLLRVDQTHEDGRKNLVLFDGSDITVWDDAAQVYAQAPQPGSIDDAFVYFTRDLQMKLPLGSLLLQQLPEELESRLISVEYVEYALAPLFPVDAQHITLRTPVAEVQLWIADDLERPWPLRLVLTYPDQPGAPQYWAEFSDWTERPQINRSTFEFKPPADAEQIVFSVQVFPMPGAAARVEPMEEQP
jgi:hypothetical protein